VLRPAAAIGRAGLALGGRGRRWRRDQRFGPAHHAHLGGVADRVDRRIACGRQVRRGGGREPVPAQILGVIHLAGNLPHRRVEVGLRYAHLGIARAHLTEVLVRRDPGRAVGCLEHAEHMADAAAVMHVDTAERREPGRGEQPRLHVHLALAVADVAARARCALRRHVAPLVGRARDHLIDAAGGCVRRSAIPLIVLFRVPGPALTEILFSFPIGALLSNGRIRVADHLEIFHWLAAMP
jgi:hypothetical protein